MIRAGRLHNAILLFLLSMLVVLPAAGALAQDEDLPTYQKPRFDRIVLKTGEKVDVQPLKINGQRRMPSPKPETGEISIQPLDATQSGVAFNVSWSDIERVDFYETMILNEGTELTKAGKFDKAFGYYSFLLNKYPETPGLNATINGYLQLDAMDAFSKKEYDRALAILGSLYARAPNSSNLNKAVDNVADKIINDYITDGKYNSARITLDVVDSSFSGLQLTVVDRWRGKFQRSAEQQLLEAGRLAEEKKYLAARQAVRQAIAIWPRLSGAEELMSRIQREHPVVVVGVHEPAPKNVEWRIDSLASSRSAEMLKPLLSSLRGYSNEGGVYSSSVADVQLDPSGLNLLVRLAEPEVGQELATGLGASNLARQILAATNPSDPSYRRVLADLIKQVRVEYPRTVVVELRRTHVRPEPLLNFEIPEELARLQQQGSFSVTERTNELVRYKSSNSQPGTLAEIHERYFSNDDDAVTALSRGMVDILARVPPWQIDRLRAIPGVTVDSYLLPTLHVLVPTGRSPITQEREFRRALCFGIDRRTILSREIATGQRGQGFDVLSGPFPLGADTSAPIRYGNNSRVKPRDYDPRLASLLASAGWVNAQKKQGKKKPSLDLPTLVLGHTSDPVARSACRSIATSLQPIIELKLVELTPEEMLDADQKVDLKYVELAVWEPVTDARLLLGEQGVLGETSDFMSAALDRLDKATGWIEVKERLREVHSVTHSDLPIIPLWQTYNFFAYRRSVTGITDQPVRLYQDVGQWQILFDSEAL